MKTSPYWNTPFIGRWIVDDALARPMPRPAVLPSLLMTFLFGPIGLGLHFALRLVWTKAA